MDVGNPGPAEAVVQHKCIGVNFIDTYYRTGLYQTPLPAGLGFEAAGIVEDVGSGVTHVKVGDRVAYAQGPLGAYSERRVIPAWQLVKVPPAVSFEQAASVLLKGLTVYYLFFETYRLSRGETILFHAAAGGVGLIACQWARHLGVDLIGTTSTGEKAKIARAHGAAHVIDYTREDVVARVKELTGGKLLPVVYDGVGRSTWETSLDCLRPRGLMVSFGNASGPVTGVSLAILAQRGSLYVTRPTLGAYMTDQRKLAEASANLFDLVGSGVIKTAEVGTYPLEEARRAHEKLLDRERAGGLLLYP